MWPRYPHLAGTTSLAVYYYFGDGPPAEGLQDEGGFYRKVVSRFAVHPDQADHYLVEQDLVKQDLVKQGRAQAAAASGSSYSITVCDVSTTMAHPECEPQHIVRLSADYYKGDRSMRESGFDISFRFGAYGSATHHYASMCLNSLLYKAERDIEQISVLVGKASEAKVWKERAETRKDRIRQYLWDAERGFFFDYEF